MEEFEKSLAQALIIELITIPYIILTDSSGRSIVNIILILVIPYIVVFTAIFLFKLIRSGTLRANFDLWYVGKLRGLWSDTSLMKQIEGAFLSSGSIKIKVTRGCDLLDRDNKFGLYDILTKMKESKKDAKLKILLIVPCFKLKHVQERYQSHSEMTEADFLESWYIFLMKISSFRTKQLSINVKFYFDFYTQWRFYIVENEKTILWLSDYKKSMFGSETPMYKIVKNNTNIAAAYSNHFDELWNDALKPRLLEQGIKGGTIKDCASCEYRGVCENLIEKYKEYLR